MVLHIIQTVPQRQQAHQKQQLQQIRTEQDVIRTEHIVEIEVMVVIRTEHIVEIERLHQQLPQVKMLVMIYWLGKLLRLRQWPKKVELIEMTMHLSMS
jgi:hypothetical protein